MVFLFFDILAVIDNTLQSCTSAYCKWLRNIDYNLRQRFDFTGKRGVFLQNIESLIIKRESE